MQIAVRHADGSGPQRILAAVGVADDAAGLGDEKIAGGDLGTVQRSVNGPVSFSDVPGHRYAPVPRLGQHTEEVLAELDGGTDTPQPPGG